MTIWEEVFKKNVLSLDNEAESSTPSPIASPMVSASVAASAESPKSKNNKATNQYEEDERVWMRAMAKLSKTRFQDLISDRVDYYDLGLAQYQLDRKELAYKTWRKALMLIKRAERLQMCSRLKVHSLEDGNIEEFLYYNNMMQDILLTARQTPVTKSMLEETFHKRETAKGLVAKSEEDEDRLLVFKRRMSFAGKFVQLLRFESRSNYIYALKIYETMTQFEECEASVLGTLTTKNKLDYIVSLKKLFNFVFGVPSHFELVTHLVSIPQAECFLKNLLNFYPEPQSLESIQIENILSCLDMLSKTNQEDDLFIFWEIYLKIQVIFALKVLGEDDASESIEIFSKVTSICQMIYEIIKIDAESDIKLHKKSQDKRKKLVKRFSQDIGRSRRIYIEIAVTSMYYLFMAYYKIGYANIKSENKNDEIKRNATLLQSFIALAELDDVFYDIPQIEVCLSYMYELLAYSQSMKVIPTLIPKVNTDQAHQNPTAELNKLPQILIEKLISHCLVAISRLEIDNPIVPLLFNRILHGIFLHGGYNILCVIVINYLMEMSLQRSQLCLFSVYDVPRFYSEEFLKMIHDENQIKPIINKIYQLKGVVTCDLLSDHQYEVKYLLPQVLLTEENKPIIMHEYASGILQNNTLRINLDNTHNGILKSNKDSIRFCNSLSKKFMEVTLIHMNLPIVRVLNGIKPCNETLKSFFKRPSQTGKTEEKGLKSPEFSPLEEHVANSADFKGFL